jgi:hypothetical protein
MAAIANAMPAQASTNGQKPRRPCSMAAAPTSLKGAKLRRDGRQGKRGATLEAKTLVHIEELSTTLRREYADGLRLYLNPSLYGAHRR